MSSPPLGSATFQDASRFPAVFGLGGTSGTAAVGTEPVVIGRFNETTGAMYVQDLSGAAGTTTIAGSISDIGKVHNAGTIASGSLTNVATLHNGTVVVSTIPQISVGTIPQVSIGTIPNVTVSNPTGTVVEVNKGTINLGTTVISSIPQISVGTIPQVSVGTLPNTNQATGTITTGSIANVAMVHAGTHVHPSGTVTTIVAGTQNTLGTVGVVNNIVTGTIASMRQDYRPVGSSILSTHALGTGGGTVVGTLVAPTGAGTSLYLAGLSIVVHSGTVDCGIANNVAGTTGAGVYARGFFPPGGGIAKDYTAVKNLGTNGTIAYFMISAGTVSFQVDYWVTP